MVHNEGLMMMTL